MILKQVHHKIAAVYTAAMTTAKPTPAAEKTATIVASHATSRSSSHNAEPIRHSQRLTDLRTFNPLSTVAVPLTRTGRPIFEDQTGAGDAPTACRNVGEGTDTAERRCRFAGSDLDQISTFALRRTKCMAGTSSLAGRCHDEFLSKGVGP